MRGETAEVEVSEWWGEGRWQWHRFVGVVRGEKRLNQQGWEKVVTDAQKVSTSRERS